MKIETGNRIKELEKELWERTEEIKVASVTMENLRTIRKELEAKLAERAEHCYHACGHDLVCTKCQNTIRNAALEEAAKEFDGLHPQAMSFDAHVAARIRAKKKP